MVNEHFFDSRSSLVQALTDRLAALLVDAIKERGSAVFLASGGGSPQPVYEALSECDLPWSLVRVALVDERWVHSQDAASNEAFIRRSLLKNCASDATVIGMKSAAESAISGVAECEQRYSALPDTPDICLLGMGHDGHTASLFPYARGLEEALSGGRRCAPIVADQSEVTGIHAERTTVTLSYILAARCRALIFSGEEKQRAYREALAGENVYSMPVRAILNHVAPTDVYWAPE